MTWGLAAIMVALACARTAVARAPVAALLALALGPLADNAIDTAAEEGVSPPIAVAKALFFRPGRDVFFHPGETGRMRPWRTSSGLRLWVPERLNRCFRAPLPCTPHPAANLRLRAGSLGGGFRVLGGWQPNRWPNPRSDFLAGWRERHRETPAQAAARESESRSGG
jgi:hypothetical protein